MLIYEVNLTIDLAIIEDFKVWLKEHMQEVVKLGGFEKAQLFSRENDCELTVHYHVKDRATLDAYLKNHAPRLREEGLKRFPNQFSATRRVLLSIYPSRVVPEPSPELV